MCTYVLTNISKIEYMDLIIIFKVWSNIKKQFCIIILLYPLLIYKNTWNLIYKCTNVNYFFDI